MMIPYILGGIAATAGVTGVKKLKNGATQMLKANKTRNEVVNRHEINVCKFNQADKTVTEKLDRLGNLELRILNQFEEFSDTIEKIQNRPVFKEFRQEGVNLPTYDKEELKKVSIGARALLGGLSGAALGTVGGIAAAGATTSAVMAVGTASTGTAISSLNGIAATNATLAALGGGSIEVGGGGMLLGSIVLGAATWGVGILVGGLIFDKAGKHLSDNVEEAWNQMKKAEKQINRICEYLFQLEIYADNYFYSLKDVYHKYLEYFRELSNIVNVSHKTDWNAFTKEEKIITENTVLLVGLLHKMCQVNLVEKAENEEINTINQKGIGDILNNAMFLMKSLDE